MPIIKIKNPNYVEGSGEKWIDAAIYTNLSNEGVEEAPNNGKDYVRRDSDWVISQKIYDELGITKARFESLLNNAYIIPTLYSVPDESTLVYVDGEYNVNFKIGDYCRVRNTDSEYGYDFFRLYDIKDGLAVWSAAETEGGSGGANGETALISLISNQSASDNSLIGASIQVYDVTDDKVLSETTWQGTEIILNIPSGHTYTVVTGGVEGYKSPSIKTLEAVKGATRILNMLYDCTILTVNFSSNHSVNTSTATATISYDNKTVTVSGGQSVKVPYDANINVTCSKILYYQTPTITAFTAGSTTKEINAEYMTSYLVVNYTKNQSVGGSPNISVVTEGLTRNYSANMLCAPGESVTINFGGITYYKTPASITFIKGLGTETKQGDYLSEKVTVSLSTNDSKAVTNLVITLTCSSNSSYSKSYTCTSTATTGDSGFVQYIPYGYKYSVTANNYFSYAALTALTYTANTTNRTINLLYVYTEYVLKIKVYHTNDDDLSIDLTVNGATVSVVRDGFYLVEKDITVPAQSTINFIFEGGYYSEYAYLYMPTDKVDSMPLYNPDLDGSVITINTTISQNTSIIIRNVAHDSGDSSSNYTYIDSENIKYDGYITYNYKYYGYGELFASNLVEVVNSGQFSASSVCYSMNGNNNDYYNFCKDGGLYTLHNYGKNLVWVTLAQLRILCKNGQYEKYAVRPFIHTLIDWGDDYYGRINAELYDLYKRTCLDGSIVYTYKILSLTILNANYGYIDCDIHWWGY